jgi:hypothetical protein
MLIFLSACSEKSIYNSLKDSDKYNCIDIINPQDRRECEDAPRADYEDYQQYLKTQK